MAAAPAEFASLKLYLFTVPIYCRCFYVSHAKLIGLYIALNLLICLALLIIQGDLEMDFFVASWRHELWPSAE